MNKQTFTCIVCPRGCQLTVLKSIEEYQVTGNYCKRGEEYGIKEATHPMRIVTSTVKIKGAYITRLPVVTDKAIDKNKIMEVMKAINQVCVKAPIHCGDMIIQNLLNTEVNLIASRSLDSVK